MQIESILLNLQNFLSFFNNINATPLNVIQKGCAMDS